MSKTRVAIAWNSSCGGCDESIVDIENKILDVAAKVEFVLWPCAMDFKYSDVEALEDQTITVSLINGGIQNTHQEHIARLLRKKSRLVVAFGSCASYGGVPSLANLTSMREIFRTVYLDAPSNDNPGKIMPAPSSRVKSRAVTLPQIYKTLVKLDDIIAVDYYLPGCPPTAAMIADAITAVLNDAMPVRGTVLAPDKALCASCSRNAAKPDEIVIGEIKRIHQVIADPGQCFLAQGVLCMGPATRDGCGYSCIKGNMPCTGCMGPLPGADQGAGMAGSLGGVLAGDDAAGVQQVLQGIPDPAGSFYRYTAAASLLGRKRKED